jgi:uncharacterized protein YceH (UPF0502 family)
MAWAAAPERDVEAMSGSEAGELAERIAALEREVEALKQRLDALGA